MRIDLQPGAQSSRETARSSSSASHAASSSPANVGLGEDQAQISGAHVQVQALAAQAMQLPEIRHERVQSLRQAVLSGSFQPRPELVASAMFEHMMARPAA